VARVGALVAAVSLATRLAKTTVSSSSSETACLSSAKTAVFTKLNTKAAGQSRLPKGFTIMKLPNKKERGV
jgi:AMMECR1 domain-containing protein